MNSTMPEQNGRAGAAGGRVAWQAVGILAAAVVIGIVYNQTSPLGVRKPSPEEPSTLKHLPVAPSSSPAPITPPPAGGEGATTNIPSWDFLPPVPSGSANPVAWTTELHFPELKWPAVKTLLAANQIVLIDARLAETYALSRIPGAVSLPAYSSVEQLQAFAAKHPRETRFVIYCNSETCDMAIFHFAFLIADSSGASIYSLRAGSRFRNRGCAPKRPVSNPRSVAQTAPRSNPVSEAGLNPA